MREAEQNEILDDVVRGMTIEMVDVVPSRLTNRAKHIRSENDLVSDAGRNLQTTLLHRIPQSVVEMVRKPIFT